MITRGFVSNRIITRGFGLSDLVEIARKLIIRMNSKFASIVSRRSKLGRR